MGFCFRPSRERGLPDDVSPTITAREYVSALSRVLATLPQESRGRCQLCSLGTCYLAAGSAGRAAIVFTEHVRRDPADEGAHRMLGLAHVSWGNLKSAVRHLEIALGLVRRKVARAVELRDVLQLQCEAALVRLVLIRLHVRLGEVKTAFWLAQEGQRLV